MEVNEDMTIEECLLRVKTNLCAKYEYPINFILAKILVIPLLYLPFSEIHIYVQTCFK